MRITATKGGVTRTLSNIAHINAFVSAGYTITMAGRKLYADGKPLFSTQEINAYVNGGWDVSTGSTTPTYTVTFAAGTNGTLTGTTTFTVPEDTLFSTITIPGTSPADGYRFSAWSPALPGGTTPITSDLSFTAQFVAQPIVTFNAGTNGTLNDGKTQVVVQWTYGRAWSAFENEGNIPTTTPEDGYQFGSWNPSLPSPGTPITGDLTFTAQWIPASASPMSASVSAPVSSEDALAALKAEADSLGITYRESIGYDRLYNRVQAAKEAK